MTWVNFFVGTPGRAIFWLCVALAITAGINPQIVLVPLHNLIGVVTAVLTQLLNCLLPLVIIGGIIIFAYRLLLRR